MSTITIPHPAPAAPHIGCDTDADFAAIVEIGFDQVLTAPDGCTKYLASSVALTPEQIADWSHPKSTPTTASGSGCLRLADFVAVDSQNA